MKRMIPLLLTVMLLVLGLTGTAMAENRFSFDKKSGTIFEGETLQLTLIREGDCAEEGKLSFKTSSKKVATVDENGLVQGLAKGRVTITATLKGAKRSWTATVTVNVARRVESISVDERRLSVYNAWDPAVAGSLNPSFPRPELPVLVLQAGKAQKISATCAPSTATNRRWKMTTSDDSIVRVSGTNLTGRSAGECIVTVQSEQNPEVSKSYRVMVVQPVTRITLTGDAKNIYKGDTLVLNAQVSPANATIRQLTWSSSRPDNATVDEYGVVTGMSKGNATITAKAADGSGRYATYVVNVLQPPEELTLSKTEVKLSAGRYANLRATVSPSTTSNKTVTWSTSDASVAKVSTSGRVTAVSPGVAIITCESKTHPQVYAQAIVSVYQPVTKIAFTTKNPYVAVGERIRLDWNVTPDTATDTSVTLSTNKTDVVRVEQDGTITGLKRGECYVYATANDGSGKKGTVKVQVTQPVEGVSIKYDERSVGVKEKVTNNAVFHPSDASITRMKWSVEDATIATVSGTGSKVTVTGRNWGETTVIGVTEDGSYVTTFKVKVGNVNRPLNIANLYVEDGNVIRIAVHNESNLTITRFYYIIETFDAWGEPVVCNRDGRGNDFEGHYGYTLEPGTSTRHGRFTFGSEFRRPEDISMVTMRITAYQTADGDTVYVPRAEQEKREWKVKVLAPEAEEDGQG